LLKQKVGALQIACKPADVNFRLKKVKGNYLTEWTGAKVFNNLPIGEYKLIAKADGYKTQRLNLSVEENKTLTKRITLEEGVDYVDVNFSLDDSYELFIDGAKLGRVSSGAVTLPTGKHVLKLANKNSSAEKRIYIDENLSSIKIKSLSNASVQLSSMLVPGLGQMISGRVTMGIVYFSAFSGAVAYGYLQLKDYWDLQGKKNTNLKKYKSLTSFKDKTQAMKQIARLDMEQADKYDMLKKIAYVTAGIYVINLFDVLGFTPIKKEIVVSQKNNKYSFYPSFWYDKKGYYFNLIIEL
jgi:hypothetical protein